MNAPYRRDVDGLRGIAVAAVVVFHTVPARLSGGFAGVDVFFVISGYLITRLIRDAHAEDRFSLADFYARRIRRLFPALGLVLAACLAAGWVMLYVGEYAQLGRHAAAGAGFVSNLALRAEAGYFDAAGETKPLLHLWSLGVEEQFYVVWPLLLTLVLRWRPRATALVAVGAALSLGASAWITVADPVAAFYGPVTRFWELAVGALVAGLQHERPPWRPALASAASLAGLVAIGVSFVALDPRAPYPGLRAVLPVVGTALLLRAGDSAWFNRYVLGRAPLVGLGLVSYPLYLWHWPLLVFARILVGQAPPLPVRLGLDAVALLLAWITWRWIEQPVRRGPHRRRQVAVPVGGVLLAGLVGFAVHADGGVPGRYVATQNDLDVRRWHLRGPQVEDCSLALREVGSAFCARTPEPTVALVGDSHAGALFTGFRTNTVDPARQAVQVVGAGGCAPVSGFEGRPGCARLLSATFDILAAQPSLRTVVLAAYHGAVGDDDVERYAAGFEQTIDRLVAMKRRVVFVVDNPALTASPEGCATQALAWRAAFLRRPAVCDTPTWQPGPAYARLVVRLRAARPGVDFVDARGVLCPGGACRLFDEGLLLYGDSNHLSTHGSRRVADELLRQMAARPD